MKRDRFHRIFALLKKYGFCWLILYCFRMMLYKTRMRYKIERVMMWFESVFFIVGSETISSQYNTIEWNKEKWSGWNWDNYGEEWTRDIEEYKNIEATIWKNKLLNELLFRYIKSGSVILEIGPGGGRWTEHLEKLAEKLILVDVSEKCLDICRDRFKTSGRIEYILTDNNKLPNIPDHSIDRIWSYDVFVHINPMDTETYIKEIARILKRGGIAIIHHPGTYNNNKLRTGAFRSAMNERLFSKMVRGNNMEIILQDTEIPHKPGDVITIFRKR